MTSNALARAPNGRRAERISRGESRRVHPPCEKPVNTVPGPRHRVAGAPHPVREPTR
jgi:hypothetical protein